MLKSPLAGLVVLALVAGIFATSFFTFANESLLINLMAFLALAQGINLLYGFTGYMPFGYVGFFGTGAYGCALTILFLHWNPIAAVVAGGLSAVVLGVILVPLLRLEGAYFGIASLAAAQAAYEIISNPNLTSITQGPYGINLGAVYAPTTGYWTMLGVLLFTTAIAAYFRISRFGLSLMAIRDNSNSAATAGVNVLRGRLIAWLLSCFIGGLAGGAFAWNISFFYPQSVFALTLSIFPIVFAVFGGVGTVIGPLVGAGLLYGLYDAVGVANPEYFQLLYGLLIVALLLFMPGGLVSLAKKVRVHVF